MSVRVDFIPVSLRELPQWVLWKMAKRSGEDKPTKMPFQIDGTPAKANDPSTWTDFDSVVARMSGYDGIGFEFSADDPFCGIDLDGCRDPESGAYAEWARKIILAFDSYAEVSPTHTGVKIFCRAKLPWPSGKNVKIDAESVCEKVPAIEVYDHARYFAVTGMRLKGQQAEPMERQAVLDWLIAEYWPTTPTTATQPLFRSDEAVVARARKYLARIPPAINGQGGHNSAFRAACVLVQGFDLSESDAMDCMREYNQTCQPAWSEAELMHKVKQAAKQPGQRGYLRNAAPERWDRIQVPTYGAEPAPKHEPRVTTLADSARKYAESLRNGTSHLIELGIPDLDYALGGGVESGEMVILAARPSHCKSAVGLQCLHHWTGNKIPCAIISEEMSSLALGKRTLQYISDVPQEHWQDLIGVLDNTIEDYAATHAQCVVIEGCGTADVAEDKIKRAVQEHGVQRVVVDYAQLLGAPGRDRYQQMTSMSIKLRTLASSQNIVLMALCQMSRSIESRNEWTPQMSDLKDTGQLEQDADVIVFLCWPHRLDPAQPLNKFQFFVGKNRNRGINQAAVTCHFSPERQTIRDSVPDRPTQGHYQERSREPKRDW